MPTEFLGLPAGELEEDKLPAEQGEAALEAVVRWIPRAPQDRRQRVAVVLGEAGAVTARAWSSRARAAWLFFGDRRKAQPPHNAAAIPHQSHPQRIPKRKASALIF